MTRGVGVGVGKARPIGNKQRSVPDVDGRFWCECSRNARIITSLLFRKCFELISQDLNLIFHLRNGMCLQMAYRVVWSFSWFATFGSVMCWSWGLSLKVQDSERWMHLRKARSRNVDSSVKSLRCFQVLHVISAIAFQSAPSTIDLYVIAEHLIKLVHNSVRVNTP